MFSVFRPYRRLVIFLVVFALLRNGLNLWVPHLVSDAIDGFIGGTLDRMQIALEFGVIALLVFIFTYAQGLVQTYTSEKVARDLRNDLGAKISDRSYVFVQDETPSKLLTYLTSDIDAIKMFVSMGIVSMASSLVLIIGASVLLLSINWKLALVVLMIIPLIGGVFSITLMKVRVLFVKSQEIIDWLNKVINENILGAALIRVLNAQTDEYKKFVEANTSAMQTGFRILSLFAGLIPLITFVANLATLAILLMGGHFVIDGSMSLGDFAAFTSYLAILIFPIIVLGMMSTIMARATASYARISGILNTPRVPDPGIRTDALKGAVTLNHVTHVYGEKSALKDVTLSIAPKSKTAILGPTAAGKTQLLYVLTGLLAPTEGRVLFDGIPMEEFEKNALHKQIGFVFQDSILFNLSLRENIAFGAEVTEEDLRRAIATAELDEFIGTLPQGLDTLVSERGTTLSGGQKQRVMLARALALNPKILLLDDFTARVDAITEKKILGNVTVHYPDLTLISVTQKVAAVEAYDQIVVLMEGEVLATGTHEQLLKTSPEYVQIYTSQQSTNHYELPTE